MSYILSCILLIGASFGSVPNQPPGDDQVVNQAESTLSQLEDLEDGMIELPDWYMTFKDVYKGRDKIARSLGSALEKYKISSDPETQKTLVNEYLNASLWYSEVTSEDFQVFMRRFVTGRPISKDVIDDLRKSYLKWIKSPNIKNLDRYSQLLLSAGRSYEILTRLQVTVDDDKEIEIKYQAFNTEEVATLHGPVTDKKIPVGNYFVWLEKDGQPISQKNSIYACITGWSKIQF
jgi:hypothetical protein